MGGNWKGNKMLFSWKRFNSVSKAAILFWKCFKPSNCQNPVQWLAIILTKPLQCKGDFLVMWGTRGGGILPCNLQLYSEANTAVKWIVSATLPQHWSNTVHYLGILHWHWQTIAIARWLLHMLSQLKNWKWWTKIIKSQRCGQNILHHTNC